MYKNQLEIFIKRFDNFNELDKKKQVDYFGYFLTSELKIDSFTAKQIKECFDLLSIKQYSRIAAYLSENSRNKKCKYLKNKIGYRLERSVYDSIKYEVINEPKKIQVLQQLTDLASKIKDSQEKAFLLEAINCYCVESFRATIIMIWILARPYAKVYI